MTEPSSGADYYDSSSNYYYYYSKSNAACPVLEASSVSHGKGGCTEAHGELQPEAVRP